MSGAASSRGVSLIEALVALAVMSFGMLGVVGMQTTLRFNADSSRQRAEAVRMAQEKVEDMRAFGVLAGSLASEHDYSKIVAATDSPTPPAGFANTTFTRVTTVTPPLADQPRMKTVEVMVSWTDRKTQTGATPESVKLTANIAAVAPEIGASLGLPGDRSAPARPKGRHPAIPQAAVDLGNGTTSSFAPPGAPAGQTWTFVNATGQIAQLCSPPGTCTGVSGWLLSGHIQFIEKGTQPTPALAEAPLGNTAPYVASYGPFGVQVTLTVPTAPPIPPVCFVGTGATSLPYYCFVPTDTAPTVWSGQSTLTISNPSDIAGSMAQDNPSKIKICRYSQLTTTTGDNRAHPLSYSLVDSSLANQNFLVMSAGAGGNVAYTCPGDGPNPLINSNTLPHQPSS